MKLSIKIDKSVKETEVIIISNEMNEEVENLSKLINSNGANRIIGKNDDEVILLDLKEAVRFYSLNKKVYAYTTKGEYEVNKRLYELEEILDKNHFVRVSNTDIVSLNHVKRLDFSFKGTIAIEFEIGDCVYVSRSYLKEFKRILGM